MSVYIIKGSTETIINDVSKKIKEETDEWHNNMKDVKYLRNVIHQIANGIDVPFDNILKGIPQTKKYNDDIDEDTGYYKAGYLNIVLLKRKIGDDIKFYNIYKDAKDKNQRYNSSYNDYKKRIDINKNYIEMIELELEHLKLQLNSIV